MDDVSQQVADQGKVDQVADKVLTELLSQPPEVQMAVIATTLHHLQSSNDTQHDAITDSVDDLAAKVDELNVWKVKVAATSATVAVIGSTFVQYLMRL